MISLSTLRPMPTTLHFAMSNACARVWGDCQATCGYPTFGGKAIKPEMGS